MTPQGVFLLPVSATIIYLSSAKKWTDATGRPADPEARLLFYRPYRAQAPGVEHKRAYAGSMAHK